jgi:hypothetical protein
MRCLENIISKLKFEPIKLIVNAFDLVYCRCGRKIIEQSGAYH